MLSLQTQENRMPLSDTELASAVAAGHAAAFEQLMRRYNRALYRTARSIVKDDAEAEDVLQDAYLLAYRSIGKFRGEAKLSTWLTRIVVNEGIARLRKTVRRAEIIHLDDEMEQDPEQLDAASSVNTNPPERPEEAASRSDMRRLLESKIDALPEAFRTVFMLRALEEMTVEEVSSALDIPEATVRTRFFRARGMLREALSREIDFAMEDAFRFDGARCDRIVHGVLARLDEQDKNNS